MSMRRLLLIALALAVTYLAWTRMNTRSPANDTAIAPTSVPPQAPDNSPRPRDGRSSARTSAGNAYGNVGFHSHAQLAEHFQKHGAEFRAASVDDYLHLAQMLRDAPSGGDVLEIVRPADNVVSRFDRASGAFLAFDRDGTIRTFFKPNDGEAYFRRQARRSPSR
jgi:hypothetical protein